jgi:hypothetical protein
MIEIRSPELVRLIDLFEQAPRIVGEEMERAASESAQAMEAEVRQRTPRGETGKLSGAVRGFSGREGDSVRFGVRIEGVPYAQFVEEGTGVYHEPGAREPWTVRPVAKKALRFTVGGQTFIRKSATIQGMRPRRMVQDGAAASEGKVRRAFETALLRVARRMRVER